MLDVPRGGKHVYSPEKKGRFTVKRTQDQEKCVSHGHLYTEYFSILII